MFSRLSLLTVPLLLAACASPSVGYIGVQGVPVDVGDSRFTVFQNGADVQVIRTSREVLPRRTEVFARAATAIERATGCEVRDNSLTGDQAVINGKVNC